MDEANAPIWFGDGSQWADYFRGLFANNIVTTFDFLNNLLGSSFIEGLPGVAEG